MKGRLEIPLKGDHRYHEKKIIDHELNITIKNI